MTLQRTKSPDWQLFDKFTSAQANAIDQNIENALDKRTGQTDTLGAVVTQSGGGRLVETTQVGPDADTTFTVGSSNEIVPTSLTTARTYTLSNTGAVNGDKVTIVSSPLADITVKDAAASTLVVLSIINNGGSQCVWAEFKFNGTAWTLFRYSLSRDGTYFTKGKTLAMVRGYCPS